MPIIAGINRAFTMGLVPVAMARNNAVTSGHAWNTMAEYVNHLLGKRLHVLAQWSDYIQVSGVGSSVMSVSVHTSANCKRAYATVIAGRTSHNTSLGSFFVSVDAYTMPTIYVAGTAGGTSGPNDLSTINFPLQSAANTDLSGDTTYFIQVSTGSVPTAILAVILWEAPRDSLDTASDTAVPRDVFAVNAPILDRDIDDITQSLWKGYKRSGLPHFTYVNMLSTTPSAGATFKNVLDASTAGFSSNAAGYFVIPYRKNRMTKTTLDVVFWCLANTDPLGSATDGVVRFVGSGGTLASITGIPNSASVRTTTATIDATTSGSQLVIVEHSSATSTIFTLSAGMYELI